MKKDPSLLHLSHLRELLISHIASLFSVEKEALSSVTCTLNTDPEKQQFGDINSNAALILAKICKQKPHAIAQQIVDTFKQVAIERIEIAGAGFLNIFLTSDYLHHAAHFLFDNPTDYFSYNPGKKEHVCIEFVSANPTGPLHLGHGRGGIIGDVLGSVLSFMGHQVVKEFYINDAGAQIQKLAQSFKIRCQQAAGLPAVLPEEAYHGEYLVTMAQECITQYSDNVVHKDLSFFAEYAKNYLLSAIKKTLINYGIHFNVWFSETDLHEHGAVVQAAQLLTKLGYAYKADNALWLKSTAFGDDKDRVLQRASGEYTYIAVDVAYLQNKLSRGFTKLIMILGQDHHSYVNRMKAVMQALGNNPDDLTILLYQLVTLKEDGQQLRMSKRAGTIVDLQEIIETVGTDVARFFYLHRKADAHLDFDLGLALKKTDENPVFYIQYAYVRIHSIMAKAAQTTEFQNLSGADICIAVPDERTILKKLLSLHEILGNITLHYQTHILAYYVIELAHLFHRYYAHHRIIDAQQREQSRSRLALIQIIGTTLGVCLDLLGLTKPTSM